jgi:hypothetical protein
MKRTAILLLISVGLSPVLFSSYASAESTAGNSSYLKATAGSNGVQWTGGNYVSSEPSNTVGNGTGSSHLKATAGSNGVQWTGGNYVRR